MAESVSSETAGERALLSVVTEDDWLGFSKKVNRKVQEKPQAEATANPRHQEEEKSDTD